MTAQVIDGNALAGRLIAGVAAASARLVQEHGLEPGLAVVLVGEDPASEIYVRSKTAKAQAAGLRSFTHVLPCSTTEAALLELVRQLNADPAVHGILVQLPLPPQIDANKVITAIDPAKDVDGFHPTNAGRLAAGLPALTPCTPLGCIRLARSVHPSMAGLEALVIGRSNIVGKPLIHLLMAEHATVTAAHSKSRDLPALARRADMVFAAVGRPGMVTPDWIKPGATVIDIGINRVARDGASRVVGDVAPEVSDVAGALTPVPGGVGPMTIACLMVNTLKAATAIAGLPEPEV